MGNIGYGLPLKYTSNFTENNIEPVEVKKSLKLIPIIITVSVIAVLGAVGLVTFTVIRRKKIK